MPSPENDGQLKQHPYIMKVTFRLFYLLTISICLCNCSSNNTKNKELASAIRPDFLDNGRTVDSLKKVFNCESIEYDNWGFKKVTDSCLTVCLINSTKVPSGTNADSSADQLKGIALSIKKSLKEPQTYKLFYIIFIKKENVFGQETKTHSQGMEIAGTEL